MHDTGTTVAEAEAWIGQPVRCFGFRGKQGGTPAILKSVNAKKYTATVRPQGHKSDVEYPLNRVRLWRSRGNISAVNARAVSMEFASGQTLNMGEVLNKAVEFTDRRPAVDLPRPKATVVRPTPAPLFQPAAPSVTEGIESLMASLTGRIDALRQAWKVRA